MQKEILILAIGSINADLVAYKSTATKKANYAYGSNFEMNIGGKSLNVALTTSIFFNDVVLIARIGDDIFGQNILSQLNTQGLNTQYIKIDPVSHTGIGHVRVDTNGEYDTIVINGANWNLNENDIDVFIADGYRPKYVVFNLETNIEVIKKVIPKFKALQSKIVINFSPIVQNMRDLFELADIAVLNLAEAQQILETQDHKPQSLLQDLKKLGPELVVITLGQDGAAALGPAGVLVQVPAQNTDVLNTIGAGDGFIACFVYSLAMGLDIAQSMINSTHVGKMICAKRESYLDSNDVEILNSETTFVQSFYKSVSVER